MPKGHCRIAFSIIEQGQLFMRLPLNQAVAGLPRYSCNGPLAIALFQRSGQITIPPRVHPAHIRSLFESMLLPDRADRRCDTRGRG